MDLKAYRLLRGLTLDKAAEGLGLTGSGRPRAFQRVETGEVPADADLVEAIARWSENAVTADDMQKTRLAFLKVKGRARDFEPVAVSQ